MDSATNTTTQATPAPTALTPPTRKAIRPKVIRVTEGALKANLATDISGIYTLGLSSVATWRDSLPILKQIEPSQILVAFDADARTNRVVAGHLHQYFQALTHNGIEAALEVWDAADGKGIDDLLAAGKQPTVITGDEVGRVIAEIVASANKADPTPQARAIDDAKKALEGYAEAIDADRGNAFDDQYLDALIALRNHSLIDFQRVKQSVLKPRALVRDVEQIVKQREADASKKAGRVNVVQLHGGAVEGEPKASSLQAAPGNLVRLRIVDAPVPENAIVPRGWILDGGGVSRSPSHPDAPIERVLSVPAVIEERFRDLHTGLERVRLAWFRHGRWYRHVENRGVVSNSRKLIDLAEIGLPVVNDTAGLLARYLVDFEETNINTLRESIVTSQIGWLGRDCEHGFLLGKQFIGGGGTEGEEGIAHESEEGRDEEDDPVIPIPETLPSDDPTNYLATTNQKSKPSKGASAPIEFLPSDGGDEQIAAGFSRQGSLDGWLEAIAPLSAYPRARLALYASFAAPLLQVIGAPNFIVNLSSTTSRGKTVTLRAAASVWGNPDETAEETCLYTWDSTRVRIERTAAVLKNLPLILDDTKRAKHPREIARTIYDFTSGQGRGRGSLKGVCEQRHWRTVMISTGEQPIYSFTEDGGTRGRVVELWSAHGPFGGVNAETARVVNLLDAGVKEHYGHAGRELIKYLLGRREEWGRFREIYRGQQKEYSEKAGDNAIAIRLSAFFAVLDVAAMVAHAAISLPWEYSDPIEALWDELIGETQEADRADAALAHVMSWASANDHTFFGRAPANTDGTSRPAPGGMSGRWDKHDWDYIAFYPHKLREIIEAGGHDSEGILRTWRDRGYLRVDGDKNRLTCKIVSANERKRMIVIEKSNMPETAVIESDREEFNL